MKIVDVCAFYTPKGGGVRTYVDRKLEALSAAGHDVVVVAPGPDDRVEERPTGGRIRWLRSPLFPLDRNYRFFAGAEALHRLLDDERPDVVEASSPWRSASTVADWRGDAARALVMHADPLSAYAYRWFGPIADRDLIDKGCEPYWRHLRRLNARYDFVVSAGTGLSNRLRAGGLTRVATVPMGVDPGVFSPALRDLALRRDLLALCNLDAGATLLLGVGRLAAEKRWEMVAAAATAAAWHHPIGLVIAGDGGGRRGLERAIGDNPHIRLLGRVGDRNALARIMASCDAVVHGCEAETFCFAAAEAGASGRPLIVPDGGGAADHARAAGGWLFQPGDAADAARAIGRFVAAGAAPDRPIRLPAPPVRTMDAHFDDLLALYGGAADMGLAA